MWSEEKIRNLLSQQVCPLVKQCELFLGHPCDKNYKTCDLFLSSLAAKVGMPIICFLQNKERNKKDLAAYILSKRSVSNP